MKPIMFVGTGSDVGKSIIATGMCRILKQDGFKPAPFKAQNMSLNSFATKDGLEMGRAQVVQAEASGVVCDTRMNPILLKPTSQKSSQIVLHGKPVGNQSAKDYFLGDNKKELFKEAKLAFDHLQKDFNPIVMEGAGSISELNLKHRDIVNMRMAAHANACVYLVADIDKGGVFASVYGSIALLEPWERKLIKGVVINKFRGDVSLFASGRQKLEELTGVPVVGVVPFAEDIYIEDEDSVALRTKQRFSQQKNSIKVVVVLLPHISNYTDFNLLEKDDRVDLYYSKEAAEIAKADIIILPGTKNTLKDLQFLREKGLAKEILKAFDQQKKIIGICGGYQMMGQVVKDPKNVESTIDFLPGLGILPIETELTEEKKTVQQEFTFKGGKEICKGYEIHMGITTTDQPKALLQTQNGGEGYWLNDACWGTYMHGVLDNSSVIDDLLGTITPAKTISYEAYKEENYNLLATHLRNCLDVDYIYSQSKL